jgi:hypothetical protein
VLPTCRRQTQPRSSHGGQNAATACLWFVGSNDNRAGDKVRVRATQGSRTCAAASAVLWSFSRWVRAASSQHTDTAMAAKAVPSTAEMISERSTSLTHRHPAAGRAGRSSLGHQTP